MFETFSRSWEFSKMSYGLLFERKRLILFPLISSLAATLVLVSFALPLWQSGLLAEWSQFMDGESAETGNVLMYVTDFCFYFCNYFVIVFFNTGLVACVLKLMNGEEASVSYGLSFAMKRLPQILGWALFSAVVGVLLKVVENSHKKAGALIAAVLGSAWTALAYFVVPVIVTDGVGPVEAFKRSVRTLKSTWGTALVGNFSMGFFSFLLMLPVLLVLFVLFGLAVAYESSIGLVAVVLLAIPVFMLLAATTTAAGTVFRTYLYAYATGRTVPEDLDTSRFGDAFRRKD
jgi:hypothetical protein